MNQPISATQLAAQEDFQQHCLQPTEASIQYWKAWQEADPSRELIVAEAAQMVGRLQLLPKQEEIAAEWDKLASLTTDKSGEALVRRLRRTPNWVKWSVAASILLLLGLGLWQWQFPARELLVHRTSFGQTQTIQLADGSVVKLNANSNLRYAKDQEREIWLEGEAFFEVSKQNGQSFVVHTNKGDVQVLGTQFNVLEREERFAVTLMEGKVAFKQRQKAPIAMRPGQQIYLIGGDIQRKLVDLETVGAWRFDKMIFRNASIGQIVEQLASDFGWKLEVKDRRLLDRKINAEIPRNNPQLLLDALSALYELEIKAVGDKHFLI
ncbi:MAG: FecR domain-containing protein, partial [Bacteroidota bacterium]